MRTILASLLLIAVNLPAYAAEDQVIIIRPGSERNVTDPDLWNRVYRLELAVQQLQEKVYQLQTQKADEKKGWHTCFIKTIKGTFSSTQPTETAARAEALGKCTDGGGGIFCDENKLKCGK